MTAAIGARGRIELEDGDFEVYEENTLRLLGTHLDRALDRIERERALDRERTKFALINRTLGHELGNSLNVVEARLQLIEGQADLPEDHWPVVTERTEEMQRFVQRMQEYMRLVERDDHDLEPVSLRPTLEQKVAAVQNAHDDARLLLDHVPEVEVTADTLLGPVFENLLRNAVEHNDKETPEVRIRGEGRETDVTVEIADNGPGIPDEHKEAIRDRGTQVTEGPGNGFGLHLVTEAVDAYGGTLEIRDNDPEGTVMRVTLPVASN
ncbi:sensor histidine kinase [Haloplanus sp. GCM10025708]|uniref:sensor histidine kinase n=1 Tax=Haloplanus sp. GCM10025708 TaxID=3252679 RepID=UPI003616A744